MGETLGGLVAKLTRQLEGLETHAPDRFDIANCDEDLEESELRPVHERRPADRAL